MALESVTFQTSTLATVPSGTKVAADALPGGELVQYFKGVDGRANSELVIPGDSTYGWFMQLMGIGGNAVAFNSGNKTDGTLRVVLATDQPSLANGITVADGGGSLSIDDGGGSLTVDGSVVASISTLGQQVMAGSVPVAIASNQSAVPVSGTFFQATQPVSIAATVTVDSELTTADLDTGAGTDTRAVVGLVYAGSGGATLVSAANPLPITGSVTAGGMADNSGFTDGTSFVAPAGYIFDEVAGTALTENDVAAARLDSKRAQVLVIEDETTRGRRTTVTAAKELVIGGSGVAGTASAAVVTVQGIAGGTPIPISGTVTAGGVADNGAFVDGTTLVSPAGFIFDEVAGTALTENDVAAARLDAKRAQVLVIEDATTRGQRVAVNASGAMSVLLSNVVTEDSAAPAQPIGLMLMGRSKTLLTQEVDANNDAIAISSDDRGRLYVYDDQAKGVLDDMLLDLDGIVTVQNVIEGSIWSDGHTWLIGPDYGSPALMLMDESSPPALSEGTIGLPRLSANRNQYIQIRDATNERSAAVSALNALKVEGVVLDNAAFTDGTTPVQPAGYIFDETAGAALTENDAGAARMDAKRAQVMVIEDNSTRGASRRAAVSSIGELIVGGGGTAGSPTSSAMTVQGITSMTPVAVNSSSIVVSVTPTVSASPDYSIGDAVGGKQTLANAVRVSGGDCVLESIQIVDSANVKPQFEILFFDSDPTAATITDNSAFVFSTALAKLIHRQAIVTADYVTIDSKAIATIGGINKLLQASGSTSLYVAWVADATINLATTTDLRADYGLLRD